MMVSTVTATRRLVHEFGWSRIRTRATSPTGGAASPSSSRGTSSCARSSTSRQLPYVAHMFWYNERNRDTGDVQLDKYGLLHRDLRPKPAYTAARKQF